MKTTLVMTLGIAIAIAAIIAALAVPLTNTVAYANPQTSDPNLAGEVTSGAAEEGGSDFGSHASDPTGSGPSGDQEGRNGLSQALTDRGDPLHPSEVIGAICQDNPDAPGC